MPGMPKTGIKKQKGAPKTGIVKKPKGSKKSFQKQLSNFDKED